MFKIELECRTNFIIECSPFMHDTFETFRYNPYMQQMERMTPLVIHIHQAQHYEYIILS